MSIIDPAPNHMEEVHSDREVQALLSPTDEEPQTKGTAGKIAEAGYNTSHAHLCFSFV